MTKAGSGVVADALMVFDMGGSVAVDMGGSLAGRATGDGAIGLALLPILRAAKLPSLAGAQFPRRAWDGSLYAQTVLAEFAALDWRAKAVLQPPPTGDALVADIAALAEKSLERAARATEILQQADNVNAYWASLLMATPTSRPATWDMIAAANTVAHMVAMHFKRIYARPRPVQVYPALLPLMLTPPHPSYPNAHALESGVIAECLGRAVPFLLKPLKIVAARVGENREVAGLHFPSDTAASASLVPILADLLETCPLYREIRTEMKMEWAGITEGPVPPLPNRKP